MLNLDRPVAHVKFRRTPPPARRSYHKSVPRLRQTGTDDVCLSPDRPVAHCRRAQVQSDAYSVVTPETFACFEIRRFRASLSHILPRQTGNVARGRGARHVLGHNFGGYEVLEAREMLSAEDLLIGIYDGGGVLRYNEAAKVPAPGGIAAGSNGMAQTTNVATAAGRQLLRQQFFDRPGAAL